MAFQGNKGPDLVSLALNLMQMKRDNELAQRKMQIEEMNAVQTAQANAIKAQREAEKHDLEVAKSRLELNKANVEHEKGLGDLLTTANDPMKMDSERYAAAGQYDRAVQAQAKSGRAPEDIGGNSAAGMAASQKELSDASSAETRKIRSLFDYRTQLKKSIAETKAEGGDPTRMIEELSVIQRVIDNKGVVGGNVSVNLNNPPEISSGDYAKRISEIGAANNVINATDQLAKDIKSGKILVGPAGIAASIGLTANGLASDIALAGASDEMQEIASKLAASTDERTGKITLKLDSGKQLNTNLTSLSLAWDYVRMKRDSARFTVLELETVLRQLKLDGVTTTKDKVLGAISKIQEAAYSSRNVSEMTLKAFGMDPSQYIEGGTLTPSQQEKVRGINMDAGEVPPAPSFSPNMTPMRSGAPVAPLTPDDIQYLRSRGVNP